MSKIRFWFISALSLFLVYSIAYAASGSLGTNVTTNGGCEGAFFDVTALNEDIFITGFEATYVGTANIRVYYKLGTHQGSENNAGAWTLLGSQNSTGGTGFISTLYPINVGGVTIPAGQTYGFLIYTGNTGGTGGLATRYRTNTNLTVNNSDISISAGSGSCTGDPMTPFDGFNADRALNVVVHYGDAPFADSEERPQFRDGRLNRFDFAGGFVIYPHQDNMGESGLIFYDWYNDKTRLLVVTASQIAAVPENPDVNTLIAQSEDGRVALYRLTDGLFQAQGPTENGKTYVVIFEDLGSQSSYTSYEE